MRRNLSRDRVTVRLTSGDLWGSLRLLNEKGIGVYCVQPEDELTCCLQVEQGDWMRTKQLLEKRGDHLRVGRGSRIHRIQRVILQRPLLFSGLFFLLLASLMLPRHVLIIQVEGNVTVPSRRIVEAAEQAGIRLMASCAQVRSERMKNQLLSQIPELKWAGVNTYGCRAVISVQERTDPGTATAPAQKGTVSSIVAQRDGIVQSVTAGTGNVLCKPGQAVKRGQILISGYTDCGQSIRAERARGEVYAQTMHTLGAITPVFAPACTDSGTAGRAFTIVLGKKQIKIWKDSGISDSTCGRIREVYSLTLPGGVTLPIQLVCDSYIRRELTEETMSKSVAREQLAGFSREYLLNQMIAGTISYQDEVLEISNGAYLLTQQFLCTEMIGREHMENGALE